MLSTSGLPDLDTKKRAAGFTVCDPELIAHLRVVIDGHEGSYDDASEARQDSGAEMMRVERRA